MDTRDHNPSQVTAFRFMLQSKSACRMSSNPSSGAVTLTIFSCFAGGVCCARTREMILAPITSQDGVHTRAASGLNRLMTVPVETCSKTLDAEPTGTLFGSGLSIGIKQTS